MMIKRSMALLLVSLLVVATSEAALMANEGFDYAVGDLNGQNDPNDGFRWGWSTSTYNVEAGSLSMTNYPLATRGGKMAGSGGARRTFGFRDLGLDKDNLIDFSTDDTIYMSVMLQRDAAATWVELRLMDGSYSTDLVKFGLGSNDKFTARMNGTNAFGGTVNGSDTQLVILKIMSRATGNDEIFVQGYSEADTIGSEPTTWSASNSADMSDVIAKLDFTASGGHTARIDEIRIGSEWQDVIPEPSVLGLMAVVGGGLVFIRKRFML